MDNHNDLESQNPPPRADEIHREIESFVRDKFGDQVRLMGVGEMPQFGQPETDSKAQHSDSDFDEVRALKFDKTPQQVKEFLDRFVIQQDDAKKALAIAVCDHYNHVRQCLEDQSIGQLEYHKQNILLMGPTGVGKTYLIKQIAKLIGVPFVKADATRFTEMGFVGSNVDDLIRDLVDQANGDLELAQYGIIYLDEADKLATQQSHYGRDIGGRGVQTSLLKIMEETEVDLRASHDMASQIQSFMEFQKKGQLTKQVINTRHILFIASGAFVGLKDIIQRRLGGSTMGVHAPLIDKSQMSKLLAEANTEDLTNFGFEPEFVGRLPIRVSCNDLNVEDMISILQSSEGSILRQYERAFKAYGIAVEFTPCGIRAIAELAIGEKTGARALMTVCERLLREFKYALPSTEVQRFQIDGELVKDPENALKRLLGSL